MTLKKGHLLLILIQTATPIGAAVFVDFYVFVPSKWWYGISFDK